MNFRRNLLIFLLVVSLCTISCFAHPGRTDSNGGHNSANGYHYHHGYPAHQHTGGVCPYDFDDRTGWNSGTPSSGKSDNQADESMQSAPAEDVKEPTWFQKYWAILIFLVFPCSLCILIVVGAIAVHVIHLFKDIWEKKKRAKARNEYIQFFGGQSAREKAGVPTNIIFDKDGWPVEEAPFLYTLNRDHTKYHRTSCRYSFGPCVTSRSIPDDASPCMKCSPPLPYRPKWLSDYRRYIAIKKQFEIPDPDISYNTPVHH